MESWHKIARWDYKCSLVNLVVTFESLSQICFRFELFWVYIWDKIMFPALHILLKRFVILKTFIFAVHFINLVPVTCIVLKIVHDSLYLQSRVESELWANFI